MNVKTFQELIQYKELSHLQAIHRGQVRKKWMAERFIQWSSNTSYHGICGISRDGATLTGCTQAWALQPARLSPAGCAGSPLSQPFPTEGFHNRNLSSEVTLCSQGNFRAGTSVVRMQQAELWVNGPLLWTYQTFSKRLVFFTMGVMKLVSVSEFDPEKPRYRFWSSTR